MLSNKLEAEGHTSSQSIHTTITCLLCCPREPGLRKATFKQENAHDGVHPDPTYPSIMSPCKEEQHVDVDVEDADKRR